MLNDSKFNNWPINFSLSRYLASQARLLPANTPTNIAFVKLPTFVKLGGTLGNPSPKTDKMVIIGLLAQSASSLTSGDTGKLLQGVSSLLGGQKPVATSGTNAPTTNAAPANLLDLFKKK